MLTIVVLLVTPAMFLAEHVKLSLELNALSGIHRLLFTDFMYFVGLSNGVSPLLHVTVKGTMLST